MSRNGEIVRSLNDALWRDHDVEAANALVHPETVLVVTHVRALGKGSGVPVEAHGASVWTIRDGKVAGAKLFQSKTEALAALGRTGV